MHQAPCRTRRKPCEPEHDATRVVAQFVESIRQSDTTSYGTNTEDAATIALRLLNGRLITQVVNTIRHSDTTQPLQPEERRTPDNFGGVCVFNMAYPAFIGNGWWATIDPVTHHEYYYTADGEVSWERPPVHDDDSSSRGELLSPGSARGLQRHPSASFFPASPRPFGKQVSARDVLVAAAARRVRSDSSGLELGLEAPSPMGSVGAASPRLPTPRKKTFRVQVLSARPDGVSGEEGSAATGTKGRGAANPRAEADAPPRNPHHLLSSSTARRSSIGTEGHTSTARGRGNEAEGYTVTASSEGNGTEGRAATRSLAAVSKYASEAVMGELPRKRSFRTPTASAGGTSTRWGGASTGPGKLGGGSGRASAPLASLRSPAANGFRGRQMRRASLTLSQTGLIQSVLQQAASGVGAAPKVRMLSEALTAGGSAAGGYVDLAAFSDAFSTYLEIDDPVLLSTYFRGFKPVVHVDTVLSRLTALTHGTVKDAVSFAWDCYSNPDGFIEVGEFVSLVCAAVTAQAKRKGTRINTPRLRERVYGLISSIAHSWGSEKLSKDEFEDFVLTHEVELLAACSEVLEAGSGGEASPQMKTSGRAPS